MVRSALGSAAARPARGPASKNVSQRAATPPSSPLTPATTRAWHRQYLRTVIERDVRDVARIRDAGELGRLLALLANRKGRLFRAASLAGDVDLHRSTVEHYVSVLERLFLVRRLPAWHRSPGRRLIRSPKVHLVDSGLATTLAALTAPDLVGNRDLLGHLLESFVVQQLMAQAAWTDPDLAFWHYRDKDQVEVDLVMTRGAHTWGFEIKAGSSPSAGDGRGLARLADRCGKDFAGGVLFHAGPDILPLGDPEDAGGSGQRDLAGMSRTVAPQAARISRSAPSSAWWCSERPTEMRRKVGRPQPPPSWT